MAPISRPSSLGSNPLEPVGHVGRDLLGDEAPHRVPHQALFVVQQGVDPQEIARVGEAGADRMVGHRCSAGRKGGHPFCLTGEGREARSRLPGAARAGKGGRPGAPRRRRRRSAGRNQALRRSKRRRSCSVVPPRPRTPPGPGGPTPGTPRPPGSRRRCARRRLSLAVAVGEEQLGIGVATGGERHPGAVVVHPMVQGDGHGSPRFGPLPV